MTLEEKAKEYSGKECKNCSYRCDKPNVFKRLSNKKECHAYFRSYEGYLAGAKEVEGENKLLPNENEDYFFVYGSGHSEYNNANNNEWLSMLRKCLEMKEQGIDVIQQLEQAKEIIKKLLTVDYPSTTLEECKTIHQQAEQFLQEIGK